MSGEEYMSECIDLTVSDEDDFTRDTEQEYNELVVVVTKFS